MKKSVLGYYLLSISLFMGSCNKKQEANINMENTRDIISYRVIPFDIEDVKLLDGPFKHATELNIKSLLAYEPDRLLAKFHIEAGLEPKAEHYGGWENQTLAGHSLGHYLSACALMYKTTGDSAFLERVNYIINELTDCQIALGSGYLGAVPGVKKIFEEEIAKGDIRAKGFDLNGIWAPIYTQHKILAGLLDAYNLCDNEKALAAAVRFADWMDSYISQLDHDQIQEMLNCEHGGINESLAELYAVTGEERYLDLARKFYHEAILDSLSQGYDILPGKHANTQIPKLIGLARIYELTGDTADKETALFFWDRVVNHHSYVTGGNSDHEYFGPADSLRNRLSESTTETCNVYNMLKLTRHLFELNPSAKLGDFYERALINHILSSQHPVSGRVTYNLSLEMGGHKVYQDPEWFTCCVGTGMENHSKYASNIYFHNNEELFVNQFIASRLTWKEKNLVLEQTTGFPEEESTHLKIISETPSEFTLMIRYPYWAESGIKVLVNGHKIKVRQSPSSFVAIRRKWKNGDSIEVNFPFSIRTESMPDDPNRIAIFNGPLVLAGILGDTNDQKAYDPMYVPVFITEMEHLPENLEPVKGEPNAFKTVSIGRPRDVLLKPFYTTHDIKYSIYWDIVSEEGWIRAKEEYKQTLEEARRIEKITIDFFQPGEMQPEKDHNFRESNSWIDELKGRRYREAHNGWLVCDMKIEPHTKNSLLVEYWGGFPGSKTFDILIDDQLLLTENISNKNDGKFISVRYNLPASITNGKDKITVSFKSHEGHRVGPVFGVRTIRE